MDKQLLLLASKMLELASYKFANQGCNDLDSETIEMIDNEKKLCDDMRKWNGDDPWPEYSAQIGDSSLMHYLSDKLKEASEVV